MTDQSPRGGDPRPAPGDGDDRGAALRPVVAASARNSGPLLTIGAAVLVGLLVFGFLASRRAPGAHETQSSAVPPAVIAAPPPPPDVSLAESAARAPAFAPTGPQAPLAPVAAAAFPPTAPAPMAFVGVSLADEARRKTPTLVVDLAGPPGAASTAASGEGRTGSALLARGGDQRGPAAPRLSGDEQFAERVGEAEPAQARATNLRDVPSVIAQGTMIPAVLETAMNSDLPGYVRAVVSRDVRGFDGSTVLIPRGSRLVGQYRSGLSQGAARIFVIWTRVLRPDGASIQIASPGGDPLGRAGQEGKVHSHFFRQFAGAILLSVTDAGISRLAAYPTTQIIVGGAATGLAGSPGGGAAAYPGAPGAEPGGAGLAPIPPTITVRQGAPISIFVARDLDFSPVGGTGK